MGEQVVVKSFGDGNPWQSDDGKISLTFFETVFDRGGTDFTANWGKKEGEPSVGESLEGEFYQKDGKWRFRKASKPQGGTSSSGSQDYQRGGGKSADVEASIHRQVALKVVASRICSEGLTDDVRSLVESVERFIGEAAQGAGASVSPPEATTAPAPAQTSDVQGTHELLTKHLEANGLDWSTAKLLTDWMIETQSPEKQDEAISALQDDARKDKCVAWAKAGYEAKHGPLPVVSTEADESVPF